MRPKRASRLNSCAASCARASALGGAGQPGNQAAAISATIRKERMFIAEHFQRAWGKFFAGSRRPPFSERDRRDEIGVVDPAAREASGIACAEGEVQDVTKRQIEPKLAPHPGLELRRPGVVDRKSTR